MRTSLAVFCLILAACAPGAPSTGPEAAAEPEAAARGASPTLVIAVRVEPGTLTTGPLGLPGAGLTMPRTLFNATLARSDDQGVLRPQLVEALPELNTSTWRVLSDGRMETTHQLRPGLTWHDGTPLSAQDFVFSWQVHATPDFGLAGAPPFHSIQEVLAPDARSIVILWSRPYAAASDLSSTNDEFQPLPHHILQKDFGEMPAEALARHPYWTREFVGLGPYRLDRWEPGAFLEAVAFEGYVFGRPKIERVKLTFISDSNTTLANLLAGEVHIATDNAIGLQHLQTLRQGWNGTVAVSAGRAWRLTFFQLRPELASPRTILDLRVRRALAHAVDRQGINEVVGGGDLVLADSMILPGDEFGPAAGLGAVKYPYDPRRTEQLMNEAGFSRGPDGFYGGVGGRFSANLRTNYTADFEEEIFIMADGWRKAGFDVQETVIPAAQAQDARLGATFPTMLTRTTFSGLTTLVRYTTEGIPRPENRWTGVNRGGWSNLEYDQLADRFGATLDREERGRQVEQLVRIYTSDLPAIPLYFLSSPFPYAAGLRGPRQVPAGGNRLWNIHEWEFAAEVR